jgi:PhoH-like ATPase
MGIYFIDTSAVLNGALSIYEHEHIYLSPLVLMELENLKVNGNEHIKFFAREAIRTIIQSNIAMTTISQKEIQRLLKKNNCLMDINDHKMICEALYLNQYNTVEFITSDCAQLLFARTLGLKTQYFDNDNENKTQKEYTGWKKFTPTEEELISLYSDPTKNILNANINEYCEIFEENTLKDVLRWTGEKYNTLKWGNFKNTFLNKKIQPLNLEQKMAFDLLQNMDISVKILIGPPGCGKDYLMLLHALDLIQKGIMDKIIFVRNLIPFKDAPEIGFLAGDLQQKISWGLGPISGILGEEGLNEYIDQNIIEAVNLGFIRGCSWDRTIIYVSEGQNITGGGYKLLISRCGQGSQLWVNGDILQTDDKEFEKNNGLLRLSNSLKNNPLAGTVKLLKTERSKVADLAKII